MRDGLAIIVEQRWPHYGGSRLGVEMLKKIVPQKESIERDIAGEGIKIRLRKMTGAATLSCWECFCEIEDPRKGVDRRLSLSGIPCLFIAGRLYCNLSLRIVRAGTSAFQGSWSLPKSHAGSRRPDNHAHVAYKAAPRQN